MARQRGNKNFSNIKKGLKLSIKDIYVGEEDTTRELEIGDSKVAAQFYNSYFLRNEVDFEEFVNGNKFFVYGYKGAGKTAFLRYVGESFNRNKEYTRDPSFARKWDLFRYSQDFPQKMHTDISEFLKRNRQSDVDFEESDLNIFRDYDYEDLWTFIILSKLHEFIASQGQGMVEPGPDLDRFSHLLTAIDRGTILDRFARLVPKIRSGSAKVSSDPELNLNFDFEAGSDDLEKFADYVAELRSVFQKLNFTSGYYNLMFDEIDPRVGSGKAFDLDCILIRDLIVTIYRLNATQPPSNRRVVFSAAIRSEVLDSVNKVGKEIHKLLSQFGIHMTWGIYGARDLDHPLVKMICKKISYSEQKMGVWDHGKERSESETWNRYFRKNVRTALLPRDLLRLTWMKPRDLVRLLKACKSIDGNSKSFSLSLISKAEVLYGNESWAEIQSQISSSIGADLESAIETVFQGFHDRFSIYELQTEIERCALISTDVAKLKNKLKTFDIVDLLYRNGVIGNYRRRGADRFFFDGHANPEAKGTFVAHPISKIRLGLEKRTYGDVQYEPGLFDQDEPDSDENDDRKDGF